MPSAKLYRNGLTMGAGGNPAPVGGKRGEVVGWSTAAVRRHTRWLYGVETGGLDGEGYSLTLTLRDCPETHEHWQGLRARYLDDLTRSGLVLRTHWVTEWTRRKVPHLHLAVYLKAGTREDMARTLLIASWLKYAARWGAGPKGQHIAPITGAVGWLEYLSKHAARGVGHYQRQGKPDGWAKTGRLWGHTGRWPITEPLDVTLTREQFYRFRRLVRQWRVADARRELKEAANLRQAAQGRRRVRSARRMLRCADPDLSRVRGVSEWISESVGLDLLNVIAESSG